METARENLLSVKGIEMRVNRSSQVEETFGIIKHDMDEQIEKWIYFHFTKVRDECREFILEKKSARCMVQADFDQVSKFNV